MAQSDGAIRKGPNKKKGRIVGAIVFVSALWFGVAGAAAAENLCTAHAEIAKRRESGYAETPVAIGLSASGGSVEVFAGEAWDGRDTAPARARGVSDPVLRSGSGWSARGAKDRRRNRAVSSRDNS